MKFSSALVASLLATVAYTQTIAEEVAELPSCSTTCLQNAITAAGCSLTDYACQCGSAKSAITTQATPCIVAACTNTTDILKVQTVTTEICVLEAASGSSSSVASSATTSVASSATSGASSVTSSAGSVTSSAASGVSSTSSKASTKASSATSTSGSSATATTSSAAQASTAGGSRLQAAGGIVGAAVIAAMAL